MLVGYAHVSTAEQILALQQDALTAADCERLFTDTASGSHAVRPGLDKALGFVRPGNTLVVWRLERLGRSLRHLIDTVALLQQRGIGFRSLQEQIDTTTSGGKLVFHVFGALAKFERDLIRERTQAGLVAALTRYLHAEGISVVEVNRPDRATRRRRGKTDAVDAEAAARAVLAGQATATAKTGDGSAEMARMFKLAKASAVKACTRPSTSSRRCWCVRSRRCGSHCLDSAR